MGQCVMTCPTTACYNGLPLGEKTISVGGRLRYFGDGWQISKRIGGRRYWRIPVMDGEFLCEETFGTIKGVAGGNLILMGAEPAATLRGHRGGRRRDPRRGPRRDPAVPRRDRAVGLEGRQQVQGAPCQHQHRLRPTLRGVVPAEMPPRRAMRLRDRDRRPEPRGRRAGHGRRCSVPRSTTPESSGVTAGNYGGNLGPHHIRLTGCARTIRSDGMSGNSRNT